MVSTSPRPDVDLERPHARYTVEEIAGVVGMSPRNVRAHQSRKLLHPPIRKGRACYYDESHVQRLRYIISLQRQGFNLASIAALIGIGNHDEADNELHGFLNTVVRDRPKIFYTLSRHGILDRDEDGAVLIARPDVLRAAMEIVRAGVAPLNTLRCLGHLLDQMDGIAAELVRTSSAEILAPDRSPKDHSSAVVTDDHAAATLAQGLVELLVSAFRATIEHHGQEIADALLITSHGAESWIEQPVVVENG
ncbi:MerR family transcriptional regulator [Streptomyces avermitilis]